MVKKMVPNKKKTKKSTTTTTTDKPWCFTDCKLERKHNESMVQCHLCQIWAHFKCIDEEEDDVYSIWCCNICRKLPHKVEILCEKINELHRDMTIVLNYARSLERISKPDTPVCINLCDNTPDDQDKMLIAVPNTITSDLHTDTNECLSPVRHEHNNEPNTTEPNQISFDVTKSIHEKPTSKMTEDVNHINDEPTILDKKPSSSIFVPKPTHDIYFCSCDAIQGISSTHAITWETSRDSHDWT